MFYHWLGREAELFHELARTGNSRRWAIIESGELVGTCQQPICDGDFTNEETVESDGLITVYCSGPIRPIPTD